MKSRKWIMMMTILVCFTHYAHGQTFNEWFRQKRTQRQYLLKQIAELQLYMGYLKDGYNIVQSGIATVRDIKNGEFNLHGAYYSSLKNVNPKLRKHPQVSAIMNNHQYILQSASALQDIVRKKTSIPQEHRTLLETVCRNLATDVERINTDLLSLLSNNELEMTDDQRMTRLQSLHDYSQRQMVFIKGLSADVYLLTGSMEQDDRDQQQLKQLYHLK